MRFHLLSISVMIVSASMAWAEEEPLNLAPNPGFEETLLTDRSMPGGWDIFLATNPKLKLVTDEKRSGERCLRIETRGRAKGHQCILTSREVHARERYIFTAYLRNDKNNRLGKSAQGMLSIEWFDAEGTEIVRDGSEVWDRNLSRIRWVKYSVKARAPAGAAMANFVIHLSEPTGPGEGSFLVDDVSIIRK